MDTAVIRELLYSKSIEEAKLFLSSCSESNTLHVYAYNYDWNDGFAVPKAIVSNPACSLGTALMIFYLADGYHYLTQRDAASDFPEWQGFLSDLYRRITAGSFSDSAIAFSVPLSKVQVFKLKKQLSEEEQVFITSIDGENYDLSV